MTSLRLLFAVLGAAIVGASCHAPHKADESTRGELLGRVARDVTGDGRPELLSLVAVEAPNACARAAFTIQSEGRVLLRVNVALLADRVHEGEPCPTPRWMRDAGDQRLLRATTVARQGFGSVAR